MSNNNKNNKRSIFYSSLLTRWNLNNYFKYCTIYVFSALSVSIIFLFPPVSNYFDRLAISSSVNTRLFKDKNVINYLFGTSYSAHNNVYFILSSFGRSFFIAIVSSLLSLFVGLLAGILIGFFDDSFVSTLASPFAFLISFSHSVWEWLRNPSMQFLLSKEDNSSFLSFIVSYIDYLLIQCVLKTFLNIIIFFVMVMLGTFRYTVENIAYVLTCLPNSATCILVSNVFPINNYIVLCFVIAIISWHNVFFIIKEKVKVLKNKKFVTTGILSGISYFSILFVDLLPHLYSEALSGFFIALNTCLLSEYFIFSLMLISNTNMLGEDKQRMSVAIIKTIQQHSTTNSSMFLFLLFHLSFTFAFQLFSENIMTAANDASGVE